MFTKRHYDKIANVLKTTNTSTFGSYRSMHNLIVQEFVLMFEDDNSAFNVEKFLDVIYGKEEKQV